MAIHLEALEVHVLTFCLAVSLSLSLSMSLSYVRALYSVIPLLHATAPGWRGRANTAVYSVPRRQMDGQLHVAKFYKLAQRYCTRTYNPESSIKLKLIKQ